MPYAIGNGVKWRSVPTDFPAWDRVYASSAAGDARV
ncbi:hypothetical protein [Streptomyces swartbergensis]|nr:hypothetical protein [Streptomyces swartbergensis]